MHNADTYDSLSYFVFLGGGGGGGLGVCVVVFIAPSIAVDAGVLILPLVRPSFIGFFSIFVLHLDYFRNFNYK